MGNTLTGAAARVAEGITDPSTPLEVARKRFLPHIAAAHMWHWVNAQPTSAIPDPDVRRALKRFSYAAATRTRPEDVPEEGCVDMSPLAHDGAYFTSWMSTSFSPPPAVERFLTDSVWARVEEAFADAEQMCPPRPTDVFGLAAVIERLRLALGSPPRARWLERARKGVQRDGSSRRRTTLAGKFATPVAASRASAAGRLTARRRWHRAAEVLGLLEGRWERFSSAAITKVAAQLDKSGLTAFLIRPEDIADPATAVFVALSVATFSTRKAFTLDAQAHGALDPGLAGLLDFLIAHEDTTNWDAIMWVYPGPEVLDRVSAQGLRIVHERWVHIVDVLARFLEAQWAKGVDGACARDMLVPRAGGEVDSTGWNNVAGAWSNAVRQLRGVCSMVRMRVESIRANPALATDPQLQADLQLLLVGEDRPLPEPAIFKCLKLTAGDQMMWAEMEGKGVDPDTAVFRQLALDRGILPWTGLRGGDEAGIREAVLEACTANGVSFNKWLAGAPSDRRAAGFRAHRDMVCGVTVSVGSEDELRRLRDMGAFRPPRGGAAGGGAAAMGAHPPADGGDGDDVEAA